MSSSNYSVDDGNGTNLCGALTREAATREAQQHANRTGLACLVYGEGYEKCIEPDDAEPDADDGDADDGDADGLAAAYARALADVAAADTAYDAARVALAAAAAAADACRLALIDAAAACRLAADAASRADG
jgi:hypothetical protein